MISRASMNVQLLQMEQSENSKSVGEEIDVKRSEEINKKAAAAEDKEAAGIMRGDAQDAQTRYTAIATTLAAVAACCMLIPVVGAAIAAVIAAIAAVFAILAAIEGQNKQQQAAKLEKDANMKEIMAEVEKKDIDELKKDEEQFRNFVQDLATRYLELNNQSLKTDSEQK